MSDQEQQDQHVFSVPSVDPAQLTTELQASKFSSILIGDVRYKADADMYCLSFTQPLGRAHMNLLHTILNNHTVA